MVSPINRWQCASGSKPDNEQFESCLAANRSSAPQAGFEHPLFAILWTSVLTMTVSALPNTPVTRNPFLLCSSEWAQTVCELIQHSTNLLNGLGRPEL